MSYAVFVVIVCAAVAWWLRRRQRQHRQAELRKRPIPDAWRTILAQRVPLYGKLPHDLRCQLHGLIQIFLDEKRFFGRGGLEVTETMRVIIAAHACLLLLNRATKIYPTFTTILVYPDTYVAHESTSDGMINSTHSSIRSGESWFRGPVILSWRDTLAGVAKVNDGHNVALHEFAHKLDEQDGRLDGLPILDDAQHYRTWATVLSREFTALSKGSQRRNKAVMDDYAATSAPEFFAVATETFFEKPLAMRQEHPALYAELRQFYRLDPSAW